MLVVRRESCGKFVAIEPQQLLLQEPNLIPNIASKHPPSRNIRKTWLLGLHRQTFARRLKRDAIQKIPAAKGAKGVASDSERFSMDARIDPYYWPTIPLFIDRCATKLCGCGSAERSKLVLGAGRLRELGLSMCRMGRRGDQALFSICDCSFMLHSLLYICTFSKCVLL